MKRLSIQDITKRYVVDISVPMLIFQFLVSLQLFILQSRKAPHKINFSVVVLKIALVNEYWISWPRWLMGREQSDWKVFGVHSNSSQSWSSPTTHGLKDEQMIQSLNINCCVIIAQQGGSQLCQHCEGIVHYHSGMEQILLIGHCEIHQMRLQVKDSHYFKVWLPVSRKTRQRPKYRVARPLR